MNIYFWNIIKTREHFLQIQKYLLKFIDPIFKYMAILFKVWNIFSWLHGPVLHTHSWKIEQILKKANFVLVCYGTSFALVLTI